MQLKNLCIVKINRASHSETFIQAHINHLPARIKVLYGARHELYEGETDRPLLNDRGFIRKVLIVLKRKLTKGTYEQDLKRSISAFLKAENIDLVLAEYGTTGVHLVDICQELNIPLIVHFHSGGETKNKEYQAGFQRLFTSCKAMVVVSKAMEKELLDLGAPANKVFYNVYGVDTNRFTAGQPEKASATFLAVGRFVSMKAPYLTLLAFAKVLHERPDARLIMIGNQGLGDQHNEIFEVCLQLVKALRIQDSVTFTGTLPHEKVCAYLKTARAYVMHSITTITGISEGTPNAILEAMLSGLPVISTIHAGIPDVVSHGKTGFLVDETDVDAMATYMLELANNPQLAAEMGSRGREYVMEHHTMNKSIANLWKIISD